MQFSTSQIAVTAEFMVSYADVHCFCLSERSGSDCLRTCGCSLTPREFRCRPSQRMPSQMTPWTRTQRTLTNACPVRTTAHFLTVLVVKIISVNVSMFICRILNILHPPKMRSQKTLNILTTTLTLFPNILTLSVTITGIYKAWKSK